ncbi:ribosome hibernation-promoting factor, HPF/YfiA family [Phytoactinopolyspora halotolerans]|uniref:Ribosome hibernation promoting factor n=1 Tax=Phytoactinopolyspora halotolerans TaxID=1981512 RepID=A0A6L9SBM5_9ACTN|nr:ribosome-associated translation inhibitor RaiA [Phytoactinopolyspora halotolerans]NEE02469.1 ribosome-associated translation inhibitor RaiA [Phytoactinopolyspora halotolerans]
MDIVVKGRRTDVPERFREHVAEKLTKLSKFDHKVIRVEVEVAKERNPRRSDESERVELTVHSKGPVIRAEAAAADKRAALDLAMDKLIARMRKAADRRRVHHGNRTPMSVAAATAPLGSSAGAGLDAAVPQQPAAPMSSPAPEPEMVPGAPLAVETEDPDVYIERNGPMVVREKTHKAAPMTRDQALYEMELVGHDFYLFVDSDTKMPSVVYRRQGYDYGVIRLDV